MRELNETGFMHNRVRMVTASFLCKHLLIDWRWVVVFAMKLLDYELASNNETGSGVLELDVMQLHTLEFLIHQSKLKNLIKNTIISINGFLNSMTFHIRNP